MSQFIDFDVVDETGSLHLREELTIPVSEINRDEVGGDAGLAIEVDVFKDDVEREYRVEGTFDGRFPLVCARCLEPFSFAVSSRYEIRFQPRSTAGDAGIEEEIEFGEDAADVEYYSERRIPLRTLASEQLQLAIPMKAICREDCAGICPVCGVNRNETRCDCGGEEVDERWKVLQQLRDRMKNEEE